MVEFQEFTILAKVIYRRAPLPATRKSALPPILTGHNLQLHLSRVTQKKSEWPLECYFLEVIFKKIKREQHLIIVQVANVNTDPNTL